MRIAVPLRNSTDAELAVLKVDLDQGAASWEHLGADQRASTLRTSDFPANMGKAVYFDRAILRDNQVILQSVGQFGQPRTGYRFGVIAQIDTHGAVKRQIYWQDYTDMPDEKKRGFKGDFTQSGDYFLAKGCYRPTDPWKGRTAAIDLTTGFAAPFKLPKGHADVTIIDHIDGQWWGTRTGPEGAMQVIVFAAD